VPRNTTVVAARLLSTANPSETELRPNVRRRSARRHLSRDSRTVTAHDVRSAACCSRGRRPAPARLRRGAASGQSLVVSFAGNTNVPTRALGLQLPSARISDAISRDTSYERFLMTAPTCSRPVDPNYTSYHDKYDFIV
jgi:hypothetical protein